MSFTFAGENSYTDYGLRITRWPALPTPKRRVHYIEIPGRDSTLWYDEGTYEDLSLVVDCGIVRVPGGPTIFERFDAITQWLQGAGESDLKFSFQPNRVIRAQVVLPVVFQPIMGRAATFAIPFTCRPMEEGA